MTTWADQFNTHEDACQYYGCDSPRSLALEAKYEEAEWLAELFDTIGPLVPEGCGYIGNAKLYPSRDAYFSDAIEF